MITTVSQTAFTSRRSYVEPVSISLFLGTKRNCGNESPDVHGNHTIVAGYTKTVAAVLDATVAGVRCSSHVADSQGILQRSYHARHIQSSGQTDDPVGYLRLDRGERGSLSRPESHPQYSRVEGKRTVIAFVQSRVTHLVYAIELE